MKLVHLVGFITKKFLRHVCPSVHPSVRIGILGSYWTYFREIWYLRISVKSVQEIQISLKLDQNKVHFTWRPIYFFGSYMAQSFPEWEIFRTKVVDKTKTNILWPINYLFENLAIYAIMWKKNIVDPYGPQMTL